jgi:hypothetical protein
MKTYDREMLHYSGNLILHDYTSNTELPFPNNYNAD